MRPTDLLVAMRYWGRTSMYPSTTAFAAPDAVKSLAIPASTRRIIVRPEPRSLVDQRRLTNRIRDVVPPHVEVVTWSEVIDDDPSLGSLDLLERHAYTQSWDLGAFFGFDGRPNVLVGATQPGTTVLWPRRQLLHRHISSRRAASAAAETVRIQHSVVSQLHAGNPIPSVRTRGRLEASILDALDPSGAATAEA